MTKYWCTIMKSKYFIFDLDDTLAYEVDYLKSAYKEIALLLKDDLLFNEMLSSYKNKEDVFAKLEAKYRIPKKQLLETYRTHFPDISLVEGASEILQKIKSQGYLLGLITDGRSVTQRNKLKALNIDRFFDKIIISEEFGSEKPEVKNFIAFEREDIEEYIYIADNVKKDFIAPNKLGWTTICLLDNGSNIHKQSFNYSSEFLPKLKIGKLSELETFI